MRNHYLFTLLLGLGLPTAALAQQPFERFGVKVKVLTLSNGRYPEFFSNDSLRRIGSVVYDSRLRRVAYLLPPDSLIGRTNSEVTSRWLTVDPLAEKYSFISPYVYVADNPLRYIDPDGREIVPAGKNSAAALETFKNNAKGDALSMYQALHDSKVTYYVNVGDKGLEVAKGGDTRFNFDDNRVELQVAPDKDMTQAILGDELKTAHQFQTGDIGFSNKGTIGYDLEDEVDTKMAAVEALKAVGLTPSTAQHDKNYDSLPIMEKIANGTMTDADKAALANSPTYKGLFTGSNAPGQRTSGEQGAAKAGPKESTVYMKDGQMVKKD